LHKGEAEASLPGGGFDVVIGNPPYVRQERLTSEMKAYFKTVYRTYHNSADLYIPFVEKGMNLLRENGKFSFIFPNKWLKAKYGKPLRIWLKSTGVDEIVDFGDLQIFEGATTYPLIMTATRKMSERIFDFAKLDTHEFGDLKGYVKSHTTQIEMSKLDDDGWQLVSEAEGRVLRQAAKVSVFLGEYTNGKILYGIKTGLTKAFVIDRQTYIRLMEQDSRSAEVLKPFVMGKDIQRYDMPTIDKYLLLFPKGFTREQSGVSTFAGDILQQPKNAQKSGKGLQRSPLSAAAVRTGLINYSNFLLQQGKRKEAFGILKKGVVLLLKMGVLHHALGLWYMRSKESAKALQKVSVR